MFPGAPATRPSPTAAADPERRAPRLRAVGTWAHTGAAEGRSRRPGAPVRRGRGVPGPLDRLGSAGLSLPSPFAWRGRWETSPQVPSHPRGDGRPSPALWRWLASLAPSCHFVTVAVVALGVGGGESLAPSPRRPPSSEVPAGGAGTRDTPTPLLHSAFGDSYPAPRV